MENQSSFTVGNWGCSKKAQHPATGCRSTTAHTLQRLRLASHLVLAQLASHLKRSGWKPGVECGSPGARDRYLCARVFFKERDVEDPRRILGRMKIRTSSLLRVCPASPELINLPPPWRVPAELCITNAGNWHCWSSICRGSASS